MSTIHQNERSQHPIYRSNRIMFKIEFSQFNFITPLEYMNKRLQTNIIRTFVLLLMGQSE